MHIWNHLDHLRILKHQHPSTIYLKCLLLPVSAKNWSQVNSEEPFHHGTKKKDGVSGLGIGGFFCRVFQCHFDPNVDPCTVRCLKNSGTWEVPKEGEVSLSFNLDAWRLRGTLLCIILWVMSTADESTPPPPSRSDGPCKVFPSFPPKKKRPLNHRIWDMAWNLQKSIRF